MIARTGVTMIQMGLTAGMSTKQVKPQSEKVTDALLRKRIKALGGKYIKLGTQYQSALPDRVCLLSDGRTVFVEVKSEGEKPTPLQEITHRDFRALGHRVEVIDTAEKVELFIKSLNNG